MQHMTMNEGDGVRLDIDRLVSSIEDMVPQDSLMPPKCSIFKIPAVLFRHNKEAFIPNAFSFGPLHHGKQKLKATEKIKAKYLQCLISRSHSPNTMLRTMVNSIMEVEKEARECYAEAIAYNPEQLVKILVIDGCFLIEFFLKKYFEGLREKDDPIFSRSCMTEFLSHDLILLENQVPWMVLEILFNLTKDAYSDDIHLILLATRIFDFHFVSDATPHADRLMSINSVKHLVDLFRILSTLSSTDPRPDLSINLEGTNHFVDLFRKLSTLPSTLLRKLSTLLSTKENQERQREWELLPSATSLVEAGIKFKRCTSQSIFDVKFNDGDGVLEIPQFAIEERTEALFRNVISYEQCHPNCVSMFTSYAVLLNNLIITPKDIDILCKNQIIDNWLTPEDATQLFNKLYYNTYSDYYYYTNLCRQVNMFCKRHWPRWRAVLVRNYFNTPWAVLSTLAAIILLILTLLQTLYGIKK